MGIFELIFGNNRERERQENLLIVKKVQSDIEPYLHLELKHRGLSVDQKTINLVFRHLISAEPIPAELETICAKVIDAIADEFRIRKTFGMVMNSLVNKCGTSAEKAKIAANLSARDIPINTEPSIEDILSLGTFPTYCAQLRENYITIDNDVLLRFQNAKAQGIISERILNEVTPIITKLMGRTFKKSSWKCIDDEKTRQGELVIELGLNLLAGKFSEDGFWNLFKRLPEIIGDERVHVDTKGNLILPAFQRGCKCYTFRPDGSESSIKLMV